MNVIARQRAREYPQTDADLQVHLIPEGARTEIWLIATGIIPAKQRSHHFLRRAVAVLLLFGCVSFIASAVPASRAIHVDPIQALRWE